MIKKFKAYMLTISSLLMLLVPAVVPTVVAHAGCSPIDNKIAAGANGAIGNNGVSCSSGTGDSDDDIAKIANEVVNIFSIIVGVAAVIMIIVGGFRYITSGGDSNRVGGAKNTLIYAIIGLVIVALAQFIVHFVLNRTSNAVNQ